MVRSLAGHIEGKCKTEIIAELGEPNGDVVTFDTPWELSVQYTWGWLDPGTFLYWPTGKYPVEHWGHATKVGDWIFLHF